MYLLFVTVNKSSLYDHFFHAIHFHTEYLQEIYDYLKTENNFSYMLKRKIVI